VGHRLGDDDEPVGQHVALDVANLRSHKGIVTHAEGKWREASEMARRRGGVSAEHEGRKNRTGGRGSNG
jgi:hypothetical protein